MFLILLFSKSDNKLHDFDVRVGGCSNSVTDLSSIPLCAHFDGYLDANQSFTMTCDEPDLLGTFLVVDIIGNSEKIEICDIVVQGGEYNNHLLGTPLTASLSQLID